MKMFFDDKIAKLKEAKQSNSDVNNLLQELLSFESKCRALYTNFSVDYTPYSKEHKETIFLSKIIDARRSLEKLYNKYK